MANLIECEQCASYDENMIMGGCNVRRKYLLNKMPNTCPCLNCAVAITCGNDNACVEYFRNFRKLENDIYKYDRLRKGLI